MKPNPYLPQTLKFDIEYAISSQNAETLSPNI